jgi:hypothetical protein
MYFSQISNQAEPVDQEWLAAIVGETTHHGALTRIFNDLGASTDQEQQLQVSPPDFLERIESGKGNGKHRYQLKEDYAAKYYLHGIHLIFRHIVKVANGHLESVFVIFTLIQPISLPVFCP